MVFRGNFFNQYNRMSKIFTTKLMRNWTKNEVKVLFAKHGVRLVSLTITFCDYQSIYEYVTDSPNADELK